MAMSVSKTGFNGLRIEARRRANGTPAMRSSAVVTAASLNVSNNVIAYADNKTTYRIKETSLDFTSPMTGSPAFNSIALAELVVITLVMTDDLYFKRTLVRIAPRSISMIGP